ncbi:MAG: hypothetical protein AAGD14_01330 [Planctomycetota bacterium]
MRNSLLSLALVGIFAVPSAAGWKKLDGQRAPAITAKEWINAGKKGPQEGDLRGKVILLEFFGTR